MSDTLSSLLGRPRSLLDWLNRFSLNDWLQLAYLSFLNGALLSVSSPSPAYARAATEMACLWLFFVTSVLVLVRGRLLTHPFLAPLVFRVGHVSGIMITYFAMRGFLPIVSPGTLDRELHEFDLALFGLEPSVAMQPFISSATTEWFAFFYYGYFFLLGLHALPIVLLSRHPRMLAEFGLGMFFVLGVGQSLYLLVPGFGPGIGTPELFDTDLPDGMWWGLVESLVASGGAQKDIFPSIHTAAPSFILLFSFHNRRHAPYRHTWPALAFFVTNIIIATLFLRWHWLLDVVAGLALAFLGHVAGVYGSSWEARRRLKTGAGAAWPSWPPREHGVGD